jgi:transcription-repair coupling factor (superfamily II helicase)
MFQGARYFAQTRSVSVPLPVRGGIPLADADLIEWTGQLLVAIFGAELKVEEVPA